MIYNDKISAFPQIGDYGFCPTGGSLHNWKPISTPAQYNATVTRFTIDKTGWDYYVGGYAFGDRNSGYACIWEDTATLPAATPPTCWSTPSPISTPSPLNSPEHHHRGFYPAGEIQRRADL